MKRYCKSFSIFVQQNIQVLWEIAIDIYGVPFDSLLTIQVLTKYLNEGASYTGTLLVSVISSEIKPVKLHLKTYSSMYCVSVVISITGWHTDEAIKHVMNIVNLKLCHTVSPILIFYVYRLVFIMPSAK